MYLKKIIYFSFFLIKPNLFYSPLIIPKLNKTESSCPLNNNNNEEYSRLRTLEYTSKFNTLTPAQKEVVRQNISTIQIVYNLSEMLNWVENTTLENLEGNLTINQSSFVLQEQLSEDQVNACLEQVTSNQTVCVMKTFSSTIFNCPSPNFSLTENLTDFEFFIAILMQYCDKLILPVCDNHHFITKVFYKEEHQIVCKTLDSIDIQGNDWSCGYFCYPFALLAKEKTLTQIDAFNTLPSTSQKLEILRILAADKNTKNDFDAQELNYQKTIKADFGRQIANLVISKCFSNEVNNQASFDHQPVTKDKDETKTFENKQRIVTFDELIKFFKNLENSEANKNELQFHEISDLQGVIKETRLKRLRSGDQKPNKDEPETVENFNDQILFKFFTKSKAQQIKEILKFLNTNTLVGPNSNNIIIAWNQFVAYIVNEWYKQENNTSSSFISSNKAERQRAKHDIACLFQRVFQLNDYLNSEDKFN